MSRSTFAAHFSRTFGRGPMDLLRELRLERAAQLLRNWTWPIKALARAVGYESRSYFTRSFRSHFGVPPGAYAAPETHIDRTRSKTRKNAINIKD